MPANGENLPYHICRPLMKTLQSSRDISEQTVCQYSSLLLIKSWLTNVSQLLPCVIILGSVLAVFCLCERILRPPRSTVWFFFYPAASPCQSDGFARVLMGIGEAGYYAGMIYYLSFWYKRYAYRNCWNLICRLTSLLDMSLHSASGRRIPFRDDSIYPTNLVFAWLGLSREQSGSVVFFFCWSPTYPMT